MTPAVGFYGIYSNYTLAPTIASTTNILGNTVTMTSAATSGLFQPITTSGMTVLAGATININNNNIFNCVVSGAASSTTIAPITNSSIPGILNINGNTIRGNTSTAT